MPHPRNLHGQKSKLCRIKQAALDFFTAIFDGRNILSADCFSSLPHKNRALGHSLQAGKDRLVMTFFMIK